MISAGVFALLDIRTISNPLFTGIPKIVCDLATIISICAIYSMSPELERDEFPHYLSFIKKLIWIRYTKLIVFLYNLILQ